MIRLIQALNYRCLRYVEQPLGPFQILVGPNASGKTTFLDVVSFLGDIVAEGPAYAVERRTTNFSDLVWNRGEDAIELAIEVAIPNDRLSRTSTFDTVRYEIRIESQLDTRQVAIGSERLLLKSWDPPVGTQRSLFPNPPLAPATIISPRVAKSKTIVSKVPGGNDNFYSESATPGTGGWVPSFSFGPYKSALGNLPEDERRFPVATWLKLFLSDGVQSILLNSIRMRHASPPGQPRHFRPDGANLPWVIEDFKKRNPDRFSRWIGHLQTALPDVTGIRTVEREDDKHRYLMIRYEGGLEVPSWMCSDGTLRLMALTLPAYLPGFYGAYLIEEPENGIHPKAVECLYQSLSSVYDAQILVASHSTVLLSVATPEQVLCFKKNSDGATDIVVGSDHPALRDWQREVTLGELLAAGVLE